MDENKHRWIRSLRAWESDLEKELNDIVLGLCLTLYKDNLIWKLSDAPFSTRMCYLMLSGADNLTHENWMKIWSFKVPPKVQLFLWKLEHQVLPTSSFLNQRLNIPIPSSCKWGNQNVETSNRLFWKCSTAQEFWENVAHWWSLDIRKRLARKIFNGAKLKNIWNMVLSAGLWTLWIGRNELIFQGVRSSVSTLELLLKLRYFKWIMTFGGIHKDLEN